MSGKREYPLYTISAVFSLTLAVSFAILIEPQRGSPVSPWPQIKWKSPVSNIMVLSPDKAQTNDSSFKDCLLGASASAGMSRKGGTDSCTFRFLIIHSNKYFQGCFNAGAVLRMRELVLSWSWARTRSQLSQYHTAQWEQAYTQAITNRCREACQQGHQKKPPRKEWFLKGLIQPRERGKWESGNRKKNGMRLQKAIIQ